MELARTPSGRAQVGKGLPISMVGLAGLLLSCAAGGCGTVCNLAGGFVHPDKEPQVYGGVKRDAEFYDKMTDRESTSKVYWPCGSGKGAAVLAIGILGFICAEPMLTVAGDTVTLPITLAAEVLRDNCTHCKESKSSEPVSLSASPTPPEEANIESWDNATTQAKMADLCRLISEAQSPPASPPGVESDELDVRLHDLSPALTSWVEPLFSGVCPVGTDDGTAAGAVDGQFEPERLIEQPHGDITQEPAHALVAWPVDIRRAQHLDYIGSTLLLKDFGVLEKVSHPNPEAGFSGQPQVPVKWPGLDIKWDESGIKQGSEDDVPQWNESE